MKMDRNEIGFSMLAAGAFFMLIGLMLLLDKSLMAAGNILIILGTFILLNDRIISGVNVKNAQGLLLFCLGVMVLFYGYNLLGFLMEILGLAVLFYDRLPTFKGIARSVSRKVFLF